MQRGGSALCQRDTSQSACEGWVIGVRCGGGGRQGWLRRCLVGRFEFV